MRFIRCLLKWNLCGLFGTFVYEYIGVAYAGLGLPGWLAHLFGAIVGLWALAWAITIESWKGWGLRA